MTASLRLQMRVGLVHFMAYPFAMSGEGAIVESIQSLAADEFYDVLEVTHIEDPSVRKQAVEIIHTAGMDLAYGSQPQILGKKLNLHSRDGELRKKSLDTILGVLNEAVEMGAVGFGTMSGPDPGEAHREEETKLFADALHTICERAKELNPNLKVVVETFDRAAYAKNCLIGPTDEAVAMAKPLHDEFPNFGLMLDLSHLPLLEETSKDALTKAAPVLLHAHIGNCVKSNPDNSYYGDNHPPFDFPDGENGLDELVEYLQVLKDINYLNKQNPPVVTIEVKPESESMLPSCLGNVKRTLNKAIAKLDS